MNDRELLELAAKAAGLRLEWQRDILRASDDGCVWEIWNPLQRDGDALRLAVKLRLVIQHAHKYVVVMDVDRNVAEHEDNRENGGDPYTATRRAIVKAAAAIGRTK